MSTIRQPEENARAGTFVVLKDSAKLFMKNGAEESGVLDTYDVMEFESKDPDGLVFRDIKNEHYEERNAWSFAGGRYWRRSHMTGEWATHEWSGHGTDSEQLADKTGARRIYRED